MATQDWLTYAVRGTVYDGGRKKDRLAHSEFQALLNRVEARLADWRTWY